MRTISTIQTTKDNKPVLLVGLGLNPDTANRLVDLGPPADQEGAADFRKFWGSKSEIRRFRDGKINEAVVWSAENTERYLIIKQIGDFLLDRFWGIPQSSIQYVSSQFDSLLTEKGQATISNTAADITVIFQELSSRIRGLVPQYIPLSVVAFHTLSPAFRDTEVHPPQAHPLAGAEKKHDKQLPLCVEPLQVLVQFENSSAWPDDLMAIQKLKSGFYIKIAQGLSTVHKMHCTPTPEYVDIQYQGYVFRLAIHQLREAILMDRVAPGQFL